MSFEELIENLVFSATWPAAHDMFAFTVGREIDAYNWVIERLKERYGVLKLRRMILLLELSSAIAELRAGVSRAIARPIGVALTATDKEGTCKVLIR